MVIFTAVAIIFTSELIPFRIKRTTDGQGKMRAINILGVQVSTVNQQSTLKEIKRRLGTKEGGYVCVTGMHGIMESYRSVLTRKAHNSADLVVPDGMPLVWLHHLHGNRQVERVYGPDLMLRVCENLRGSDFRHFLYGGQPGIVEKLKNVLQSRFPDIQICGTFSPPFRPLSEKEDEDVTSLIRETGTNILWVGLGTPKQEIWMYQHRDVFEGTVMIGVGAAFDFHTGGIPQAPRWLQNIGMEWFFRLLNEPKRLWRRYLLNIPPFLLLLAMQHLGWNKNAFSKTDQTTKS